MKPLLIAIGGGTGSGKTTIAQQMIKLLDDEKNSCLIHLDNYYKDLSHIPESERNKINFDHPESFDWTLFKNHLNQLMIGRPIEVPDYSFYTNNRLPTSKIVEPVKIILLEGIFALCDKECNKMFNLKIYVETDSDLRFIRRLKRDINERGRTVAQSIDSWTNKAKPMHDLYIQPTKRIAHILLPEHEREVSLQLLKEGIKGISQLGF